MVPGLTPSDEELSKLLYREVKDLSEIIGIPAKESEGMP